MKKDISLNGALTISFERGTVRAYINAAGVIFVPQGLWKFWKSRVFVQFETMNTVLSGINGSRPGRAAAIQTLRMCA